MELPLVWEKITRLPFSAFGSRGEAIRKWNGLGCLHSTMIQFRYFLHGQNQEKELSSAVSFIIINVVSVFYPLDLFDSGNEALDVKCGKWEDFVDIENVLMSVENGFLVVKDIIKPTVLPLCCLFIYFLVDFFRSVIF